MDQITIDTINSHLISAPSAMLGRPERTVRALAPCPASMSAREDRLVIGGFGIDAVNGINSVFTTGHQAHAAVRMHVTPATGAFWSHDEKCPKYMATPSSTGRLRTS